MDIPELDSDRLIIDGCRRLTGPSLVWNEPGAVLDVLIGDLDMDEVLGCWYRNIEELLADVGWAEPKLTHRRFENGYNLLLAAPVDQLYSAVLALETAWYFCASDFLGLPVDSRNDLLEAVRKQMRDEENPALTGIESAARRHGVDFLCDDEFVTLGHGIGSQSFAADDIPAVDAVDWDRIRNIPVALIVLLPIMAFVLKALYPLSRRYYVEHLLFFVHFHAFFFLMLTLQVLLMRFSGWIGIGDAIPTLLVIIGSFYIAIYLFVSMRRVYGQGRIITFLKYVVLVVAYLFGFSATMLGALAIAAFSI